MDTVKLTALVCLFAWALAGQQPVAFEVATVKPVAVPSTGWSIGGGPGQLKFRNYSLKELIKYAYGLRDYSLNGPGWLDAARFDVVGKLPEGAKPEQQPEMVQALLKDRFHLEFHWAPRQLSGYALKVAKAGKLKALEGPRKGRGYSSQSVYADASPAELADILARVLNQPVEDATSLAGVYSFDLKWAPETSAVPGADAPPPGPSLFTALEQATGLKLQPVKVAVQVMMVDQVDREPAEN